MNKQRTRRASDPGQYVSPVLNELEWLDEEPELKAAADMKKKPLKPNRSPQLRPAGGKQRARVPVENARATVITPPMRHNDSVAPPLLLFNKHKPRAPRSRWARELLGYDSWTAQKADQIVDAIQSFQLGLDGLLEGGEQLTIVPSHEQEMIIDITPEPAGAERQTQSVPVRHRVAGEETEEAASTRKEQQLYGFIPFLFQPFDDRIDVTVTFKQPFADNRYALVATTDQTGCHAVISAKWSESAVIRLVRNMDVPYLEGELNWIAIGDADISGETGESS